MSKSISKGSIFLLSIIIVLIATILIGVFYSTPLNTHASSLSELSISDKHDIELKNFTRKLTTNDNLMPLSLNDIKENFEVDRVEVILKREHSQINGKADVEYFRQVSNIKSVQSAPPPINPDKIDVERFRQIITIELETAGHEQVIEAVAALEKLDKVLVVQPSFIYEGGDDWTPPDDPLFGGVIVNGINRQQWALTNPHGIQAQDAWAINRGDLSPRIRVGIFETGLQANHPDLRVVANPNFAGNTERDHGTHVAGIIGAITHNGVGISGIAQVEVSLLNRNTFRASLEWAEAQGIRIVNASYWQDRPTVIGGVVTRQAVPDALNMQAIANYPGLFVASAGNQGLNNDINPQFPAGYNLPNLIAVGSSTINGNRAGSSNFGADSVHVFAPGDNIVSTYPTTTTSNAGVGYHATSGTSMAAPHVAGVAALMLSVYSENTHNLTHAQVSAQIKSTIINNATPVAALNGLCVAGGILNAYEAVKSAGYKTTDLPGNNIRVDGSHFTITENVVLPAKINGRTVTQIGDWAFANQQMLTFAFEDFTTVTSIGTGAFNACNELTLFRIPDNLTSISPWTFADIEGLFLLYQGNQLKTIGTGAFYNTNIWFDGGFFPASVTHIEPWAFYGSYIAIGLTFPQDSQLTSIGEYAFANHNIDSFIIRSSVTNIGQRAFDENDTITIYTERSSRPSGWNTNWNYSNRPVVWGCTLSSDKTYVESFTKSATNPSNPGAVNGITNPYRKDFNFGGWYTTPSLTGTRYNDLTTAPNGMLYSSWSKPSCVAEGTLITLADGSEIAVEDLTGEEMLLVWNMFTGAFDSAPILFIDSDPLAEYEITHLYFSDGSEVKVIYEHGFWDIDLNEYVFLRRDAAKYIGHWFNKQTEDGNGNMIWTAVQLVDVAVYTEYNTAYSPVTYGHLCYYVNGMLSMPGATEGLINIFEVDPVTMQYDAAAMANDIAAYGLFSYEEFSDILPVPEIIFGAFGGQYLKVSIGKGLTTMEELAALIERYSVFFT